MDFLENQLPEDLLLPNGKNLTQARMDFLDNKLPEDLLLSNGKSPLYVNKFKDLFDNKDVYKKNCRSTSQDH